MYNVLIADKLPDSALKLIRTDSKYHINLITGLSESDLIKKIPAYHDKVIASPHIGGSTEESQKRVGEDIIISIMEFLET